MDMETVLVIPNIEFLTTPVADVILQLKLTTFICVYEMLVLYSFL